MALCDYAMVPEWLPTRATARGRLVLTALEQFGARGFDAVNVVELARDAETTTGPLYHHFGSKLGLYDLVRGDVERRLTDRMEGALAAQPALAPALVVAFDYALRAGFLRLAGEPHPAGGGDPIVTLLTERAGAPLGVMLAAAWRQGLLACADGAAPAKVRDAMRTLTS
jgi:AcrR family transcriptional regulator